MQEKCHAYAQPALHLALPSHRISCLRGEKKCYCKAGGNKEIKNKTRREVCTTAVAWEKFQILHRCACYNPGSGGNSVLNACKNVLRSLQVKPTLGQLPWSTTIAPRFWLSADWNSRARSDAHHTSKSRAIPHDLVDSIPPLSNIDARTMCEIGMVLSPPCGK